MGPRARLARGAAPDDEKLSEKSLKHLNAHVYIRPKGTYLPRSSLIQLLGTPQAITAIASSTNTSDTLSTLWATKALLHLGNAASVS